MHSEESETVPNAYPVTDDNPENFVSLALDYELVSRLLKAIDLGYKPTTKDLEFLRRYLHEYESLMSYVR